MIDTRSDTWKGVEFILDKIEALEIPVLFSEKTDPARTQYARGKLRVVNELREVAKRSTEELTHPM